VLVEESRQRALSLDERLCFLRERLGSSRQAPASEQESIGILRSTAVALLAFDLGPHASMVLDERPSVNPVARRRRDAGAHPIFDSPSALTEVR
jgi:hypothetical protein